MRLPSGVANNCLKGWLAPEQVINHEDRSRSFAAIDSETFKRCCGGARRTIHDCWSKADDWGAARMLGPRGERLTDTYEFFAVFDFARGVPPGLRRPNARDHQS